MTQAGMKSDRGHVIARKLMLDSFQALAQAASRNQVVTERGRRSAVQPRPHAGECIATTTEPSDFIRSVSSAAATLASSSTASPHRRGRTIGAHRLIERDPIPWGRPAEEPIDLGAPGLVGLEQCTQLLAKVDHRSGCVAARRLGEFVKRRHVRP